VVEGVAALSAHEMVVGCRLVVSGKLVEDGSCGLLSVMLAAAGVLHVCAIYRIAAMH